MSESEIRTDLRLLTLRLDEMHRDIAGRIEERRKEEAEEHQRFEDRLRVVEKVAHGAVALGAVGLAVGGQLLAGVRLL